MVVNYKLIQKIHKKFNYHDKCDIYKYEAQKDKDGAKTTKKEKVPLYLDVDCKVSFSLRTWDMFTHKPMDSTPYEKQPKIFMDTKYKVLPGYYLEVHRYDPQTKELIAEYKGQAGLPQVSLTHQEILMDVEGTC